VRSFGIELLAEGEASLLLEAVRAGRAGRLLLEREMHAFVTTVLLRAAWLDILRELPSTFTVRVLESSGVAHASPRLSPEEAKWGFPGHPGIPMKLGAA
jgi:hypothetical protein